MFRRLFTGAAAALIALTSMAALGPAATAAPAGAPTTTPPLRAFDMPSTASLRSSAHKVFAHYFPAYPISLDNKAGESDYYATQYLTPTGENGKHAAYGGLLRDRPLPRPVSTAANWQVEDFKTEVREAIAAGIDGFNVDVLSLSDSSNVRSRETMVRMLQAAAEVDPGFKIMAMPDMSALGSKSVALLASNIASWVKSPYGSSLYRLDDGRLVLAPFFAEKWSVSQWTSLLSTLKSQYGISVAFTPTFLNWRANADAFAPISYGLGNWGNRSTMTNASAKRNAIDAHARTCAGGARCIWFQPVSIQDERPNQGVFDEASNTENLTMTWQAAIDGGSDWVQLVTWNDYSEGTSFAPSVGHGWAFLNISDYYLVKFKTGKFPTIVRSAVYLTHRTQLASAKPSFPQTKLMTPRSPSTAPRDTVEVLAFVPAISTIAVTVGGSTTTKDIPAGMSRVTVPLKPGPVSVVETRKGVFIQSAAAKAPVTATPYVQDLSYRAVESRQG